ncbi:hypothetical protein [Pedobacter punctiformis]|uniref:Lipoprotein n=1 Tax=Pedobacter punctiformis TaxID=3004097 RepID=A0ABT4L876_9SPHI|nr:hypothetical protein [Pedobacter sp. HCMS5-2]MCZ4244129.1 hypothetical protein [Pedobacter sp. HCMS5-2]
MKTRYTLIVVVSLSLQSCTVSNDRIADHFWKCGKACGLQDVLSFEPHSKNTRLSGDTIYNSWRPIAKIVKRDYRLMAKNRLYIVMLKAKITDTCIYYEQ